jgi:uncharacterized protein (DUF427 family)
MATATWNGVTIAESNDTVMVEGNHYFPLDSVKAEHLADNPSTSTCPWKGVASYYDLVVVGQTNTGAAWYYPEPKEAAEQITGRVAFGKGVTVTG